MALPTSVSLLATHPFLACRVACFFCLLFHNPCGYGATIKDLANQLRSSVNASEQIELTVESSSVEGSDLRVVVTGATLRKERIFAKHDSGKGEILYNRVIEEFTPDGYRSYQEGAKRKNGAQVRDEANFRTNAEPVVGVPLFASRYQQARLLELLENPTVQEQELGSEKALAISGSVKQRGTPLSVRLVFSGPQHQMVEYENSMGTRPRQTVRLRASLGGNQGDAWPYSGIVSEMFLEGRAPTRSDIPVSVRRVETAGEVFTGLTVPKGTIVTDERFGRPVVYTVGDKPLTDAEVKQMAFHADYPRNIWPAESGKQKKNGAARNFVRITIVLGILVPIVAVWLVSRKSFNRPI